MSNYNCTIRTNYFHVKDNEKFEEFMSHIYGEDLELFNETDSNGNAIYGFGCYGSISGYFNDNEEYEDDADAWDNAYDNFIDGLSKHVAEDDAILIFEAGHEKMRYVVGRVMVITSNAYNYKDITSLGIDMAKKMLKNSNYTTQCDY